MSTDSQALMTTEANFRPNYPRVWLAFLRNALIRETTFRSNFVITIITRAFWFVSQIVLFEIIYRNVPAIADWSREEYFAFMATGMLINAVVEAFFMPNCAEFSELIRTGRLDFVLLKPIDPQFLVSFEKVNLANLNQILLAIGLLCYSLLQTQITPGIVNVTCYLLMVGFGVCFFYSLMIALASTSVWFGRNQGLYDFWFYVTVFARYPAGIYSGSVLGEIIRFAFSYVIPILLVVTVPARWLMSMTLEPSWIVFVAPLLTIASLAASRAIFQWSLRMYRSASS